MLEPTGEWSSLAHRRRTETFEKAAGTAIVKSPDGGMDGIWSVTSMAQSQYL